MPQTTNMNLNEILNKQKKILRASSHFRTHSSLKAEQLCQATNCKKRVSFSRDCKEYLIDATGVLTVLRARHYK